MSGTNADVRSLSGFVWSIAEILRGDFKQSEYGVCAGVEARISTASRC